jgi:hypothetical protein
VVLFGARLSFNKNVVLRYRLELESWRLSSSTINWRLAPVRRLAYEAADTGLLSLSWRPPVFGESKGKANRREAGQLAQLRTSKAAHAGTECGDDPP